LVIAALACLAAGFGTAWVIMAVVLGSDLRRFGFGNLASLALLMTIIYIIILDRPLGLGTFEWAEAFWPGGEKVALPKPAARRRKSDTGPGQAGNSLKVSGFIVLVVVLIAGFASLIPQVESPAPESLEISGDLSGPELASLGEEVFQSAESGCLACHGLGREGLRAPDLAGIGALAAGREAGKTAEEYLREALVDPCAYVVEGYDCIMPQTLAQSLGSAKITALVAFLQSQGGEITVSLSAEAAESDAEASSAGGGSGIQGTTGEEIMTNAAPSCITCHQLDAIGAAGAVGPDLSQVGARLNPDEIRASILTPDAVIAENCPGAPCTPGVMPKTYGEQLNAMQLETLVTFLSEQK
jgi:mono/diheme cytochrome c family protein